MTLMQLRQKYPSAEFHTFDADGWEVRGCFIHDEVGSYERKVYRHEEDGEAWETEHLFITMAG